MTLPDHNPMRTSLTEPAVSAEHDLGANSRSSESRIDLATCRTLLGNGCNMTDEEVLRLRDVLYDLASVVLDSSLEQSQKTGLIG